MSCSPCQWPVSGECLPEPPVLGENPSSAQRDEYEAAAVAREDAINLAIDVLWALSGRQFGTCPVIVRPCPSGRSSGHPYPYLLDSYTSSHVVSWDGGHWVNNPCGCAGTCTQSGPRLIHLPGPVYSISKVGIGDGVLGKNEYVLEGDVLYRVGGVWPSQNLGVPIGEDGSWYVKYLQGYPPPESVGRFVGTLAAEFLKACSGAKCRLPRTVSVVNRQGVTYKVYEPSAVYASGKTGIEDIDLWLASVNPRALSRPPSVL